MNIKELVEKAHANAQAHGFYDEKTEIGTKIALIHSELSEALEEERSGKPQLYYNCVDGTVCRKFTDGSCNDEECDIMNPKPEGIASELADVVIRVADLCGYLDIDLEKIIVEKMAYNESRPYKHGRAF